MVSVSEEIFGNPLMEMETLSLEKRLSFFLCFSPLGTVKSFVPYCCFLCSVSGVCSVVLVHLLCMERQRVYNCIVTYLILQFEDSLSEKHRGAVG